MKKKKKCWKGNVWAEKKWREDFIKYGGLHFLRAIAKESMRDAVIIKITIEEL